MSTANPTSLGVGFTGALNGVRWRVAGRVVMSMADSGETYYWNEFHLVGDQGRSATLVFEETEAGPEWKLFDAFQPLRAMTVAEAATKRIGDRVALDGLPRAITLVGQSRVAHIDGIAPEGVEVGDVARYFNIDTGDRMLVASWTGEEIEFFEGRDVPPEWVAEGFGFSDRFRLRFTRPPGTGAGSFTFPAKLAVIGSAVGLLISAIFFSAQREDRRAAYVVPARPAVRPAPTFRLANGSQGMLRERNYTVSSQALVEVARVGSRHEGREYALVAGPTEQALLINGLRGNRREWHLLLSVTDEPSLARISPFDAAVLRKYSSVPWNGRTMRVTDLFQSRLLQFDLQGSEPVRPVLQYGFLALEGGEWLMARWTEGAIQFYRGQTLPEAEVLAALGPGPEKAR